MSAWVGKITELQQKAAPNKSLGKRVAWDETSQKK
jgi:hypothetical protein